MIKKNIFCSIQIPPSIPICHLLYYNKFYYKSVNKSTTEHRTAQRVFLLRRSLLNINPFSLEDFLCRAADRVHVLHPIKNAPYPAQTPNMVHIFRRICLPDAISVILNELLSYEHPPNRQGRLLCSHIKGCGERARPASLTER